MMSFTLHADSALAVPLGNVSLVHVVGGSADRIVYFGSPDPGAMLQAAADPGVAPIELHVEDTDPAGGAAPADIRLALSAAGLDSATPGAPLVLGTTILGGAANGVAVFVRAQSGATEPVELTDLKFVVPNVLPGSAA